MYLVPLIIVSPSREQYESLNKINLPYIFFILLLVLNAILLGLFTYSVVIHKPKRQSKPLWIYMLLYYFSHVFFLLTLFSKRNLTYCYFSTLIGLLGILFIYMESSYIYRSKKDEENNTNRIKRANQLYLLPVVLWNLFLCVFSITLYFWN